MNPPQVYMCSPSWSLLPPHTIPLGCPSAPAPSIQYCASNLDWWLVSYMILYMLQCILPTHRPLSLPQSPKDCSIHQCLFCCLVYRVIGEGNGIPLQYSCLENPMDGEPGRLQSMGSLRVAQDWANSLSLFTFMRWRRKWQPTPVFLPGESQGRGSLVGSRLWGRTESDTTEAI